MKSKWIPKVGMRIKTTKRVTLEIAVAKSRKLIKRSRNIHQENINNVKRSIDNLCRHRGIHIQVIKRSILHLF